ncbi:hypothetical protein Nepgr_027787 [Nepenthes gracilis]|uniref:Late embryogenesis abundant protein Lea5 n=1 Tax=Nepenthes gracilis TaxID=150966 RepID=A0AAD3TAZ1_NEPGR|nr:hypothetical protein Nepgr_027787 [Nepenthes gracilis]
MARSFSYAKLLSAVVVDNISLALNRRGYAAASQGVVSNLATGESPKLGKASQEETSQSAEKSWVPDPVTGYYRPANRTDEIDVSELRQMFIKNKKP